MSAFCRRQASRAASPVAGSGAAGGADVYDISLPLVAGAAVVPGDPPFARRLFLDRDTDGCEAAVLSLSAHSGTHLDFPAHFLADGKRAGDYPAEAFLLPAMVVPCGPAWRLGPELLADVAILPGEAVLFRSRNSEERLFTGPTFPDTFAALTPELARELVRRGTALVGLDAMSVEPLADPAYPVHHILLGAGVLILEGLDLIAVPPGRRTLCCLPLAIPEAEASPVRAVLMGMGHASGGQGAAVDPSGGIMPPGPPARGGGGLRS
jgi:arylformamidase